MEDHLESLPLEVQVHVLRFISPQQLCRIGQVSKRWYQLAHTPEIWKELFVNATGIEYHFEEPSGEFWKQLFIEYYQAPNWDVYWKGPSLEVSDDGRTVTRSAGIAGTYWQMIRLKVLLTSGQVRLFSFRIDKWSSNSIMFRVVTNLWKLPEGIPGTGYAGASVVNRAKVKGPSAAYYVHRPNTAAEGDIVSVLVNLQSRKLFFIKNLTVIFECELPENLYKEVYVVASFSGANQQVSILSPSKVDSLLQLESNQIGKA